MHHDRPSAFETRTRRVVFALVGVGAAAVVFDLTGLSPLQMGQLGTMVSAAVCFVALGAAVRVTIWSGDGRFAALAGMYALIGFRQAMAVVEHTGVHPFEVSFPYSELPGHLLAMLSLLVMPYGLRLAIDARAKRDFQQRLHDEYERYRGMFEENTAVKLLIDPTDGRIIEANPAAARYYGWTRDELQDMRIDEINCLAPDEVRAEMARARQSGKRVFHFRHRLQDGSVRDVHVHSSPVRAAGRDLLYSIVFDVTERLRSEERNRHMVETLDAQARALAEARREAEIANENKSAFLANMSHEIRTPMTAVLGFAEALRDDDLDEDEQDDAVATILESGQYLLRLINQLLDIAKVESGRMELDETRVEVPVLLDRVQRLLAQRAADAGLDLRVRIDGRVPLEVLTDELKIEQVLVNLVGNAIKYTEVGRVTLRVAYDTTRGSLDFAVEDTGPGMDAATLEHVFEPFAQARAAHARTGTGLGLPLARRFAELLGGSLDARSAPGRGSVFTMCLPVAPAADAVWFDPAVDVLGGTDDRAPTEIRRVARAFDRPVRILVAEDVRANQVLLERLLARAGASVEIASNGREAVDVVRAAAARGEAFELVLMDVQMPVMDGIAATGILVEQFPGLPVLALTAGVTGGERAALDRAGMRACLAKPVDRDELFGAVIRWTSVHESVGSPD